jgi:hypothetical protein
MAGMAVGHCWLCWLLALFAVWSKLLSKFGQFGIGIGCWLSCMCYVLLCAVCCVLCVVYALDVGCVVCGVYCYICYTLDTRYKAVHNYYTLHITQGSA